MYILVSEEGACVDTIPVLRAKAGRDPHQHISLEGFMTPRHKGEVCVRPLRGTCLSCRCLKPVSKEVTAALAWQMSSMVKAQI